MTRQNTPTSMHDSDEREVESEEKQHGVKNPLGYQRGANRQTGGNC
jgi:hypothetical protein